MDTSWFRRSVATVAATAVIGGVLPATPVLATVSTADQRTIAALQSLSLALDQLPLTPGVGTPLPMTLRSPADLLGFPALFSTAWGTPLSAFDGSGALQAHLTGLDVIDSATVTTAGDVTTVTLDLRHETTTNVPVAYLREGDETTEGGDPPIAIAGAGDGATIQSVTTTLTGRLTVRVDGSVVLPGTTTYDPEAAATLDPDPTDSYLDITVAGNDTDLSFTSSLGLTEVDVTGTGAIGLGIDVGFEDPDGEGGITRGEWEDTLFEDLTTVTPAASTGDDLAVTLTLDSGLVSGAADGTVSFAGDLATWTGTTPTEPTATFGDDLANFTNVTTEDALAALAQFATAIQGAENAIDHPLPFVGARFSDLASPGDTLMGIVERQGAAAVVCGKLDTSPPAGAFLAGTTWYCQAYTTQDPEAGSVVWSVTGSGVSVTANGTSDTTVGVAPSANVVIAGTEDEPDVSVTFQVAGTEGGTVSVTADRRFRSAQELEAAIDAAVDDVQLAYLPGDGTTPPVLTLALDDTQDPAAGTVPADIGDLLRNDTRLAGVEGPDADSDGRQDAIVSVDVGEVHLDAGFGLNLADDVDTAVTDEPRGLRYLFLAGDGGDELRVADLSAAIASATTVTGRIGYLPVSADLTAGSSGDLTVTRDDTTADALSVDVPVGTYDLDGDGADDASTLIDVLTHDEASPDDAAPATPAFNLTGALHLAIDLDGLSITGYDDGAGTIDATWTFDPTAGRVLSDLAVSTDSGGVYDASLKPFDLSPTLTGVATSAGATLTDTTIDFTTAFGFTITPSSGHTEDTSDDLPFVLVNLETGASCAGVEVTGTNQLTCVEGSLAGSERLSAGGDTPEDLTDDVQDNGWAVGDPWQIVGDPTMLRGVVLDALAALAQQLAATDDATHNRPLALVGLAPADMTPQFALAAEAIGALATRPLFPDPADASVEVAPADLAELEDELVEELDALAGVSGSTVDFALEQVTNPATDADSLHLVVEVAVPASGSTEAPIRLDFGAVSTLDLLRDPIDPDATSVMQVDWSTTAALDVAIPFDPDVPLDHVVALETSGITSGSASADETSVDFTGSFGALRLDVGAGAELVAPHTPPTGDHDGALPASGTAEAITGSADAATTATEVVDAGVDFLKAGLTSGATVRQSGSNLECTVGTVQQHRFTCALPPTGETANPWASGDTYTVTAGHPTTALFDADGGFTSDLAGDLLVNVTDSASCVLAAADITSNAIACSASWSPGDSYEIRSRTVLEDATRVSGDAARPGFDELLGSDDGDPIPTATITNVSTGGSCTVTAASTTTLTCSGGLSSGGWDTGDDYRLDIGSATTTVTDAGRGFDRMGLVGLEITDADSGATCEITAAEAHHLVCDGLEGGAEFEAGEDYRIPGVGIARFELDDYTLAASEAQLIADYAGAVDGAPVGPDAAGDPVCATGVSNDACAVLSVAIPDDPGTPEDESRFLGVVRWDADISGGTSDGTPPTLPEALTASVEEEEPIEWSLLSLLFGQVEGLLRQALEESLLYEEFPLIGLDVSAGSHLEQAIDLLEAEVAGVAPPAITETTTMDAAAQAIHDYVVAALGGTDGLQWNSPAGEITVGTVLDTVADVSGEPYDRYVGVTLKCKTPSESNVRTCNSSDVGGDIVDVQIDVVFGDNIAAGHTRPGKSCVNCASTGYDFDVDFDLGLDGLPIDVTADVDLESRSGWRFGFGMGLSRVDGPYLVVGTDPNAPELEVGADVRFPDATTPACPDLNGTSIAGELPVFALGFSPDRCAQVNIGFFQGTVFDGDGDPFDGTAGDTADGTGDDSDRSELALKFTADLSDTDGKITIADLASRSLPAASLAGDADGNLDLYFVTGVDASGLTGDASLPSLEGAIHGAFDVSGSLHSLTGTTSAWDADFTYDRLILNLGSFLQNFLLPVAEEINKYVKPLRPVIDFVRAPIPVLSDISKATGNPPITVLDVIDAAGFDTTLVGRVLDAIILVADLADAVVAGYIALGGDSEFTFTMPHIDIGSVDLPQINGAPGKFAVSPKEKRTGPCGKTDTAGNKQSKDCKGTYNKRGVKQTTTVKQFSDCGPDKNKPCTGRELTRTVTTRINKPRLRGMGLTFPVLDDPMQLFWMVLGESEPVLVRFDAGTLAAGAGVSVSFGPFMAGPVPVDVSIGAWFDFSARFAMGYDVRGIVNLLKQDPEDFDPSALMDGLFIDDLDVNGNDVPEIVIAVTATVGAAVSIKIFKVGLEGGVTVAVEFNIKDPDVDGRLRIDEIRSVAATNPLCIFQVRGTLTFFVNVYVAVDLFVKTLRYTIPLFRLSPPIELFKVECATPPPILSIPEDDDGTPSDLGGSDLAWHLRLLLGSPTRRSARHYATDEEKEKFVIRQLSALGAHTGKADTDGNLDNGGEVTVTGTKVSVEAWGLYQEFIVPTGGRILADAGTEADTIRFESGTDEAGNEIAFTVPVTVRGGSGNDRILTGAGADVVHGDGDDTDDGDGSTDNDSGNDSIQTGEGADQAHGGGGDDDINGGWGADVVNGDGGNDRVSGDAGGDLVRGGAGQDDLTGGPGLDPDVTVTGASADAYDAADVLVGDGDADSLRGHFGADTLFGDGVTGFTTTPSTDVALLAAFAGGASGWSATNACASTGGSGGGDTLLGEAGDDALFGGPAGDELTGGRGDDHACGNDGRDLVDGDAANLSGEFGDDDLSGGSGNDRVYGRDGEDTVDGGADDDLVDGGPHDDVLQGGTGSDALVGADGHDIVVGDAATITGNDISGSGHDAVGEVALTAGSDSTTGRIACLDRASLRGGRVDLDGDGDTDTADDGRVDGIRIVDGYVSIDDDATANEADDVGLFLGFGVANGVVQAGDQYVFGATMSTHGSADCLVGGLGHDALFGGEGWDTLRGDAGTDLLEGDGGDDLLRGAAGPDVAWGGPGSDEIHGDSGDDELFGDGLDSGSSDTGDDVHGGPGADHIEGNGDGDTLAGDGDGDTIVGGSGAAAKVDGGDTIDGGPGTDRIAGDNASRAHDSGGSLVGFTLLDVPFASGGTVSASYAGGDTIDGGTSSDRIYGQSGDDTIRGGTESDTIDGNDGADSIDGGTAADLLAGGSSTDHGGTDGAPRTLSGVRDGGDTIRGGTHADLIAGDNAVVTTGGITRQDIDLVSAAAPAGVAGGDRLHGEAGADTIRGQGGDDDVWGGDDADDIEGNHGADDVWGEQATDAIIGGSRTVGATDGADRLFGGAATDRILGDNGDIVGTTLTLHDVPFAGLTDPVGTYGGDTIHGDDDPAGASTGAGAYDVVRGQSGGDTIHGQGGDDDIEGNAGADTISGDTGHDDLIGGSRLVAAGVGGVTDGTTVQDGGDRIEGGGDTDWVLGDNGVIDRAPDGSPATTRAAHLLDVPFGAAPSAATAGDDTVYGDDSSNTIVAGTAAADRVWAGSGNDVVHGQDGDDVADGNAGADDLHGGAGADDLVGGSSRDDGADGNGRLLAGVYDAAVDPGTGLRGDRVWGGGGVDVVLGDNGVAYRHGGAPRWRLHDLVAASATPDLTLAGGDQLHGEGDPDAIAGQTGDDTVTGGAADDLVQGNAGADTISGDAGADDAVGGSSYHWTGSGAAASAWVQEELRAAHDSGDTVHGDDDTNAAGDLGDTIAGDNARIDRLVGGTADPTTAWLAGLVTVDRDVETGDPLRRVTLYDVEVIGDATRPAVANAFGADTVHGDAGRDHVLGQHGDDDLFGDAGDDAIEGNAGADTISGDAGSDDVVGGSSHGPDGVVGAGQFGPGTDVADGGDTILGDGDATGGNAGHDVVLGDNGVIQRPTATTWATLAAPFETVTVRSRVDVGNGFEQAGAFGNDTVWGQEGHDEVRGQLGDDTVHGGHGDDSLLGDLGDVDPQTIVGGDPRTRTIANDGDLIHEEVFRTGSLFRPTTLFERLDPRDRQAVLATAGNDRITGGEGNDTIHGGSGNDVLNGHGETLVKPDPNQTWLDFLAARYGGCDPLGNPGATPIADRQLCDQDAVYGDHGNDRIWGGPDHDWLFGGHNADHLDVVYPFGASPEPGDPQVDFRGRDYIYGGWGQDAMQADISSPGPNDGDRLLDSVGAYNAFFVCDGAYGAYTIQRQLSPGMLTFLEDLAEAGGTVGVRVVDSNGYAELSNVYSKDGRLNSKPPHPENPGNFVCGDAAAK